MSDAQTPDVPALSSESSSQSNLEKTWWGEFDFSTEPVKFWEIGPFQLQMQHSESEWTLKYRYCDEKTHDNDTWRLSQTESDANEFDEEARFVFKKAPSKVLITPVLPDRSIVVQPRSKLSIPKSEHVTVYMSTRCWIKVESIKPAGKLLDTHLIRLSDTWFGPDKISGELCYAAHTRARLDYESQKNRPYRVTIPLSIRNHSKSTLHVTKIKVPVEYLSIYLSDDNELWTQELLMVNEESNNNVSVQIQAVPPEVAGKTRLLSKPRKTTESKKWYSGLTHLFG